MRYFVQWDIDDERDFDDPAEKPNLPVIVNVPADVEPENVSDWLSDEYGWCVADLDLAE